MTDKIVKRNGAEIVPDANNMRTIAKDLLDSHMFPQVKSIAGAVTIIEYGRELGIPPVAALNTFSIVSGRLTMEAKVMLALFLKSGADAEIIKKDKTGSEVKFTKPGRKAHTETFTIKDAEAIGLASKDNWKKYPEEMCYWRCVAKGIRAFDPEVIMGIYSKEEMQDAGDKGFSNEKKYTEKPPPLDEIPDVLKTEEELTQDAEIVEEDEDTNDFALTQEVAQPDSDPATASSPDEADEITEVANAIKTHLEIQLGKPTKKATQDEIRKFKQWLFDTQLGIGTHGRKYVAKNAHGHISFGAGKLEDLKRLHKDLNDAVQAFYRETEPPKGEEA